MFFDIDRPLTLGNVWDFLFLSKYMINIRAADIQWYSNQSMGEEPMTNQWNRT